MSVNNMEQYKMEKASLNNKLNCRQNIHKHTSMCKMIHEFVA